MHTIFETYYHNVELFIKLIVSACIFCFWIGFAGIMFSQCLPFSSTDWLINIIMWRSTEQKLDCTVNMAEPGDITCLEVNHTTKTTDVTSLTEGDKAENGDVTIQTDVRSQLQGSSVKKCVLDLISLVNDVELQQVRAWVKVKVKFYGEGQTEVCIECLGKVSSESQRKVYCEGQCEN